MALQRHAPPGGAWPKHDEARRTILPAVGATRDELSAALVGARQGDEDAFRLIYRAVQPGLLRYVWTIVGQEAEDIAAEAWAQIARDIRRFDGDGEEFRAWAATIARNRALDHLRRLRRRPTSAVGPEELALCPDGSDTEEGLATREALALIAALPPDQAQAVLLRVVMGLSAPAAAAVLGKRAGAVRMAAHRGLRQLAAQLNEAETADCR